MQPTRRSQCFRHLPILAKIMSPIFVAAFIITWKTSVTGAVPGNETDGSKTEYVGPTPPSETVTLVETSRSTNTTETTHAFSRAPGNSTTVVQSTKTTTGTTEPKPTTARLPIRLENQLCKARSMLVSTDEPYYRYVPLVVKLHRCGGSCGVLPPTVSVCRPKTVQKIPVYLFNRNLFRNEVLHLENHTSCECQCVQGEAVCDPETQYFNKSLCKCQCKRNAVEHRCPPNYKWDDTQCRCLCDAWCNSYQDFNEADCSCTCRNKYYKMCNRKREILNEESCLCMSPPGFSRREFECDEVPRKWVALIAVMSCLTILAIMLVVLLLTRSTELCNPCRLLVSRKCKGCDYSRAQALEEKATTST